MAISREKLLKIIVGIHFIWTNFAFMADWLPTSYLITQVSIIVLGLWGIVNHENVIQIELLMVVKALSILFDTVAIGMYYASAEASYKYGSKISYFRLSAGFAIFLLILKPLMILLLNLIRKERAGNADSPTFGGWGIDFGHNVPGYQPVGENPATATAEQNKQASAYPQNYQESEYPIRP